jgi:hypothetical protein
VVLVDFLRANTDIFAWSPSDMPGIPREVAEHSLDILPHSRAVQQRLRRFDEERRRAEYHVWFEDRWMVASLCDE